jgi:RNA polymerase sigma factor (sigma-70 family)
VPEFILDRVASGDPAAVAECLGRYSPLVWSLARRFCTNHADSEDAVQEIFIDLWRHAARFDPGVGSETTYVAMIARRRLIDRYRKRQRQPDAGPLPAGSDFADVQSKNSLELREEADRVQQHLQQLRPAERTVLEMSLNEGLSQMEIVAATSLPLGTVKTHARRGLKKLREMLAESDSADANSS